MIGTKGTPHSETGTDIFSWALLLSWSFLRSHFPPADLLLPGLISWLERSGFFGLVDEFTLAQWRQQVEAKKKEKKGQTADVPRLRHIWSWGVSGFTEKSCLTSIRSPLLTSDTNGASPLLFSSFRRGKKINAPDTTNRGTRQSVWRAIIEVSTWGQAIGKICIWLMTGSMSEKNTVREGRGFLPPPSHLCFTDS